MSILMHLEWSWWQIKLQYVKEDIQCKHDLSVSDRSFAHNQQVFCVWKNWGMIDPGDVNIWLRITISVYRNCIKIVLFKKFALLFLSQVYTVQPSLADQQQYAEREGLKSGEMPDTWHKWDILLHLCGGAAPPPFAAYFTRMNLKSDTLPLNLFTLSRHYQPCKCSVFKSI